MSKLTDLQRAALEAAERKPLLRNRTGWSNQPLAEFPQATLAALDRRGLVKLDPWAGCCGVAKITKAGRKEIAS